MKTVEGLSIAVINGPSHDGAFGRTAHDIRGARLRWMLNATSFDRALVPHELVATTRAAKVPLVCAHTRLEPAPSVAIEAIGARPAPGELCT